VSDLAGDPARSENLAAWLRVRHAPRAAACRDGPYGIPDWNSGSSKLTMRHNKDWFYSGMSCRFGKWMLFRNPVQGRFIGFASF
jgi:hypothetical protein